MIPSIGFIPSSAASQAEAGRAPRTPAIHYSTVRYSDCTYVQLQQKDNVRLALAAGGQAECHACMNDGRREAI